jgi:hypothetical protein
MAYVSVHDPAVQSAVIQAAVQIAKSGVKEGGTISVEAIASATVLLLAELAKGNPGSYAGATPSARES